MDLAALQEGSEGSSTGAIQLVRRVLCLVDVTVSHSQLGEHEWPGQWVKNASGTRVGEASLPLTFDSQP